MQIPSNMSEQEVVDTITRVAEKLSGKYTFAFYTIDDIRQEAFIIGMEALERYDENKPLENFLFVHIANRLKNFKRDNYFRQDEGKAERVQNTKKNLLEPANLENFSVAHQNQDFISKISDAEVLDLIKRRIPAGMRADYLRMCAGVPISKNRRLEIEFIIREIIES
jgi:DNA-directed RNA polymerase specialized sigma24 family protein|tara:strand:+ start:360 stop:860 length:501 start_codon:yes stop_codon:yes gene_type:complete